MIKSEPTTIRRPCVSRYLRAISALALEVVDDDRLLDDFTHIIALAPRTIEQLRIAAGCVPVRRLPGMHCVSARELLQ